uniref:Uncharacterized protein n=1 Tax=Panagrolaimus davidi TaxID=227884 RepID=A0A914QY13_9BILA
MKMAGFACVFAWLATAILAHQWQLSKYEDGIGQRNYLSSDDTAAEAHSSHFRRKKHLSDNNCGCTYNYAKKATSGPAVGAIK